jgi:gluconate 2-dehydrogenase gamma chain
MLSSADPPYRFLSPHQAAVLDAATHRLAPGPQDVVSYLDGLLWACVTNLRDEYINGIASLDRQAGGDFTTVAPLRQDLILSQRQLAPFTSLLFGHIIDAIYALPLQVNRCDDAPGGFIRSVQPR